MNEPNTIFRGILGRVMLLYGYHGLEPYSYIVPIHFEKMTKYLGNDMETLYYWEQRELAEWLSTILLQTIFQCDGNHHLEQEKARFILFELTSYVVFCLDKKDDLKRS